MMKIISLFIFCFLSCFGSFLWAEDLTENQDLTALLGGMVKSDRWVIRKDLAEEEFIGNVSYENDMYTIHADKALSKRKQKTFDITGKVFLERRENGQVINLTAQRVFYNQKTDKGFAKGTIKNQVESSFVYEGNTYKLYATEINFSDKVNYFEALGAVELSDKDNTLYADKLTFDRINGIITAENARPVISGFGNDGDFALQADIFVLNLKEKRFKAEGSANGWLVSNKSMESLPNLKQSSLKQ